MINCRNASLLNEKDIVSVVKSVVIIPNGGIIYRITILYKFGKVLHEVNIDSQYSPTIDADFEDLVKQLKKLNISVLSE